MDRPTASYGLDPRVEDLVGSFASAVVRGAQGSSLDIADLALLLRDLEELVCRAREAEVGAVEMIERDGWPLFDAAGRAVVSAMWHAVIEELAEAEWHQLRATRRSP